MKPQTTKEQVMEKINEENRKILLNSHESIFNLLSSTYDTAYEKGVIDAMEKVEKTDGYMEHEKMTGVVDGGLELARRKLRTDLLIALSELLKK